MLGEKLVIKLWETLMKGGVGSLASPWQIKREGKAHSEVRRDEMLMLAQAEMEVDQIKQGKKKLLPDGKLIELTSPISSYDENIDYLGRREPIINFESLSGKLEQQKKAEEIQQEININKTIFLVEEELSRSQQEPENEDIESDWLYRWRDYAKATNNEELRRFWAQTLAGEIKSPGSFSLRTLEFIKNLSNDEALAISKLGPFVINRSIFKCTYLEKQGINFKFLLQMDDLGIVNGVQGGEIASLELCLPSSEIKEYSKILVNRGRVLVIEGEDPNKELSLACYQLSLIGEEILSLGDFSADEEYMRDVGEQIKRQGFDVKIASGEKHCDDYWKIFNAQAIKSYNKKIQWTV